MPNEVYMPEMEGTKLIQRLRKPIKLAKPFQFGGGLKNGGLPDKAIELTKDIWSFDYMGAAEFEWGAVPEALEKIANYYTNRVEKEDSIKLAKEVYFICENKSASGVKDIIQKLAENEDKYFKLTEHCFLDSNLKGEDYANKILGWIELNNGFMFFTDKTMYESSSKLFKKIANS